VFSQRVKDAINQEIEHAETARKNDLEGRARVCSRRAAGYAIRAYFEEHGVDTPDISALALIRQLDNLSGVQPQVKTVTEHLLMRVDEDFNLPVKTDLIAETIWLAHYLEYETT
jgi:hypothetical protein